jgi:hypothetical protein
MLILDVSRSLLDWGLVLMIKEECGDVQISGQATCAVASRWNHTDHARGCANNLKSLKGLVDLDLGEGKRKQTKK